MAVERRASSTNTITVVNDMFILYDSVSDQCVSNPSTSPLLYLPLRITGVLEKDASGQTLVTCEDDDEAPALIE